MDSVTIPVLVDQLVSGLAIGGVYGLVALGFALIFGVLRVAQFAHGEVYMLVAFLVLTALPALPLGGFSQFGLVLVLALFLGAAIGLAVERVVFRPLMAAPHIAAIISAIGLSIALQYLAAFLWGAELHPFVLNWAPGNLTLGPATIPAFKVVIFVTALALLAGLQLVLRRTQLGRAIRATASDPETARLMGINTIRIIAAAFAVGSAFAGAAGVLVAALYGVVYSSMGIAALVKGYTATVIGGVGNLVGAVISGLLLGVFEVLLESYVSPKWSDAIIFALLIGVLVLRPQGLLGRAIPERL
ncbi:branched-chain amino acid ABC transporter permease [Thermomicrobiaceae bacterium CFH 74404]|uniref:Branched-chain amino acid ABC transporter permease n=1 Tax=Thermalbibacter longus TaxID=2951981 RepID=A0AA41WCK4_9BACT|nr:branched-chain amino acid ABC transporter permease [Thermalbibacter longus]MCM8747999.1 branched-chain amino acid ABC transporter permease [Thermalbibacter longus]